MARSFDATRVAIVEQDVERKSLLVRGMDPAVSGTFDFSAVRRAIQKVGPDIAGLRLLIVNVIDNVGERWAWTPEMQAFGVDPNTYPASQWPPYLLQPEWDPSEGVGDGQWVSGAFAGVGDMFWWPFEGLPPGEDPTVFLTAPGWDFNGVVDLVSALYQEHDNALIYFHCMLGADRTGALHTGYLMKAKDMSLAEASQVADTATSAGPPNADYQRLREAYDTFLARNANP